MYIGKSSSVALCIRKLQNTVVLWYAGALYVIVEYSAHGCLRSYLMKNHSGFVCLVCTTIVCSCSVCDHGVCANGCFLCVQLLVHELCMWLWSTVPIDVFYVHNYCVQVLCMWLWSTVLTDVCAITWWRTAVALSTVWTIPVKGQHEVIMQQTTTTSTLPVWSCHRRQAPSAQTHWLSLPTISSALHSRLLVAWNTWPLGMWVFIVTSHLFCLTRTFVW